MEISKAIAIRIIKLLAERKRSLYRLAIDAGMSRDTLKSIMKGRTKGVNLKSVCLIASGLGMTLSEFFDDPLFDPENLDLD